MLASSSSRHPFRVQPSSSKPHTEPTKNPKLKNKTEKPPKKDASKKPKGKVSAQKKAALEVPGESYESPGEILARQKGSRVAQFGANATVGATALFDGCKTIVESNELQGPLTQQLVELVTDKVPALGAALMALGTLKVAAAMRPAETPRQLMRHRLIQSAATFAFFTCQGLEVMAETGFHHPYFLSLLGMVLGGKTAWDVRKFTHLRREMREVNSEEALQALVRNEKAEDRLRMYEGG